jgi:hypothetical protein
MNSSLAFRRVSGALEFIAELQSFAAECAASGMWDDDLAARRRQREEVRAAEFRQEQADVKAL